MVGHFPLSLIHKSVKVLEPRGLPAEVCKPTFNFTVMSLETTFINKCLVCNGIANLRCNRRKLAFYCGKTCRFTHHLQHKPVCKRLSSSVNTVVKEERRLRQHFHFEELVGNFSILLETQKYREARYNHLDALLAINSCASLYAAIEDGRDLMRLARHDCPEVSHQVILFYLRTNTYESLQHCYDYIKWFDTCDIEAPNEWIDNFPPFLSIVGADMCEDTYPIEHFNLHRIVGLAFIKMRLLYHICNFKAYTFLILHATTDENSPMIAFRGNIGTLLTLFSFLRPAFPCFAGCSAAELLDKLFIQLVRLILMAGGKENILWKALFKPPEWFANETAVSRDQETAIAVAKDYVYFIFKDFLGKSYMQTLLTNDVIWNQFCDV